MIAGPIKAESLPELYCEGSLVLHTKSPYTAPVAIPQVAHVVLHIQAAKECGMGRSRFSISRGPCYEMTKAELSGASESLTNLDVIYTQSENQYQIFIPRNRKVLETSLQAKLQNQFVGDYGTLYTRWNNAPAAMYGTVQTRGDLISMLITDDRSQTQPVAMLGCHK